MAVNTLLLDFRLSPGSTHVMEEAEKIMLDGWESLGRESFLRLFTDHKSFSTFGGPMDSVLTIRLYNDSLVTVTIEYYLTDGHLPLLTYKDCQNLEKVWSRRSNQPKDVKTLPRVIRGNALDTYFPTTDERLIEYDVVEKCFDVHSQFQHIQIFQTKSFGNMLVLDDDPNLAESDSIYTDSLMRRGIENYKNADILILGGGDGALLAELLKESPNKVTMLEIDQTVMDACKTHLRSVCGTVLDHLSGPNYEILTADCLPIMTQMLEERVQFDYIFGDLTTFPVSSVASSSDVYSFVSEILDISFKLLRPGGKYLTHGPGTSGQESAIMLENLINSKSPDGRPFLISKTSLFVPSFSENWSFYLVTS